MLIMNKIDLKRIINFKNDNLKVHLFEKRDGENQKGFIYYPDDDMKYKDCVVIYLENEKVLKEGRYSFNKFKEVVLVADIIHPDDPIPLSKANGKILLKLKDRLTDN